MQYVYVPVPEDRVGEIMRLLVDTRDNAGVPARSGDWSVSDLCRLFKESGTMAAEFLLYLAHRPDQEVDASEIIRAMNTDGRAFGGMASSLSRRCQGRYGREWPISRREVGDSILYSMSGSVASVVQQADSEMAEGGEEL
jgi:hypothetical protein